MRSEAADLAREEPGARTARAGAVLLIADLTEGVRLRTAIEEMSGGSIAVQAALSIEDARERLGQDTFDVVLVDIGKRHSLGVMALKALREVAESAAIIIRGDESIAREETGPEADGWIARSDSAGAIEACIRGAIDRRRLHDELRARTADLTVSETRFRNIIERTPDGIIIVDLKGEVRFANRGAETMFATPAAELLGQNFGVAVLSGETTEMDIVGPASGEEEPAVAELRVSTTSWEGTPAQIISLRDITDRKRAEARAQRLLVERSAREEAERAEARARFLADAGTALDASLNADATLTSLAHLVVPRLADWCVVDVREEGRVRCVAAVHGEPTLQSLLEELRKGYHGDRDVEPSAARVLETGEPELHCELDLPGAEPIPGAEGRAGLLARLGTRSTMIVPLEAREQLLGAITFASGTRDFQAADLALATEIASRAARAIDNSRLFEAALLANRVKSDFLAVMSHELRTPLNAILGYTNLLLEGVAGALEEKQISYLNRVRSTGDTLLQIIGEILTYAQAEAGIEQARPRTVIVRDLVNEFVSAIEPIATGKGLAFRVEGSACEESVCTDVGKLRQITLNLLTNAVKFTDSGGVQLRVDLDDDHLVIRVGDTGIGIAAGQLEQVFEPFWQVEQGATRRAGGTGLGLAVSRQLAEMLGGELTAESTLGEGSTFSLRIPLGAGVIEAGGV